MRPQIFFLTELPETEVMQFLYGALIACGFIVVVAIFIMVIAWLLITLKGDKNA